eukprot:2239150-Karenia_brevis.AAC.1
MGSQKGSWVHALLSDFHAISADPAFFHERSYDLEQWMTAIRHAPAEYRKKFIIFSRSRFANICAHWARTKSLQSLGQSAFVCGICSKAFVTKQQFALHNFKAHGLKRSMRSYVDSTHCP